MTKTKTLLIFTAAIALACIAMSFAGVEVKF